MFGIFGRSIVGVCFILVLAACSASSSVDGGFEPAETVFLDGEYEYTTSVEQGEVVALDVLIPSQKGYKVVGASFDPDMLRLDHYLEYDDDGTRRARYIFTPIAEGTNDVLVKMTPLSGGDIEIYKQVTIHVVKDEGLF